MCSRWYECCKRVKYKWKHQFQHALLTGPLSFNAVAQDPLESPSCCFSATRFSHSACILNSYMYVFGGCTTSLTTFNDLWKIDLTTKKKSRVVTTGNYPTPKSHATMVVWRDSLVLFGGWTSPCIYPLHQQGILFDELHIYNSTQNTWKQLYFWNPPPATAGHSATLHGDIMVCFGGLQKRSDTSSSTNDIYCLDLMNSTWFKPPFSQVAPSPRYGHSQTKIDDRHLLIMSGCGGYNNLHNDVWLLTIPVDNVATAMWTWKHVTVEGIEHMPKQVWCNPVCKVDQDLVVLARKNESQNEGLNTKPQFLFKSSRPEANSEDKVEAGPENEAAKARKPSSADKSVDNCINVPIASSGGISSGDSRVSAMASGSNNLHARPLVRPNASSNREKQLSVLSMYEDRLRHRSVVPVKQRAVHAKPETSQKPTCCQVIFTTNCVFSR